MSSAFDEFFLAATGRVPPSYQRQLATGGLPASVTVPGSGRTGVMLAWLWRRLHGTDQVLVSTPRRLFYVLPQSSLVEPVAAEVAGWLTRLGLDEQVALQPSGSNLRQWRRDMHCPAIVIGTADALVSKALNRGYGIGRVIYPIDFALVTNGAQWVFDEISLCPRSAATMGRIASLAAAAGTAEPFAVAGLASAGVLGAGGPVTARLGAEPGDNPAIAAAAAELHQPGRRTLIVLNSVATAQRVYAALVGGPVECVLVHAEFRGRERRALAEALAGPAGDDGQIVVATAVVDAGLPITAELVVTELAPGASLELRAGRCERGGRLFWVPGAGTGLREPGFNRQEAFKPEEIFNTSTDGLTGGDLDVAGLVGDGGDLEAQLIWASWTGGEDGRPPAEFRLPGDEWRCRAPLARVAELAGRVPVWRLGTGGWVAATPEEPAGPGEILVVAADDGGYDRVLGFDPVLPGPVADCPSLDLVIEGEAEPGEWVSLARHSEETRDQAAALLSVIRPSVGDVEWRSVVCAAYLHDLGKAHPTWQDALCAVAADGDRERVQAGRPWAKSGTEAPLVFAGDVRFRHELASLLLVDGPLRELVDGDADRDLVRYLVLAHHGRLRVRVADPDADGPVLFGLVDGGSWPIPPVLGRGAVELTVDLAQFSGAWTTTVLALLERYGPFALAYMETLVRIADWRSSGRNELAAP